MIDDAQAIYKRVAMPICYLQAIQHKLDEIVAEVDAIEKLNG
jgi:hypothetical protein